MRSFVAAPMRYRSLFLAGDAAHIVPPTRAKGLNLAVADVTVLADALAARFCEGSDAGLEEYSDRCLRRVWRAQHFSWWMTTMLHVDPRDDDYGRQLQRSQLEYVCSSSAAACSLAENYVGLPLERIPGAQKEAVLAAERSLVTVERIVDELVPRPGGVVIPSWVIGAVAEAPGGSQPSYALDITERDNDFYRHWDAISRDRERFSAWIDEHVLSRTPA
jgi:hypothetical protein